MIGYLCVAGTVAATVYAQMIVKWRVDLAGDLPPGGTGKMSYFADLIWNPWTISAFGAGVVAALCWFAALTYLDLGRAYPVVGLTFVFVLLGSSLFFGESVTTARVAGVTLIVAGVAVASQG